MNKKLNPLDLSPSSSVMTHYHRQTGKPLRGEPGARLIFPDYEMATEFINAGADPKYKDSPITVDYLETVHEAPTGEYGQYDAFVSRPDHDSGEVTMTLRHYGRAALEDHAKLSEFVVETANKVTESASADNLSDDK